jgi:hypothetical protein
MERTPKVRQTDGLVLRGALARSAPMNIVLNAFGAMYVLAAALVVYIDARVIARVCGEGTLRPSAWVRLFTVSAIPVGFAGMCCFLAYLLFTRRHHRAALLMAAISCLGIPYLTVLGIATIVTLLWPGMREQFSTS